MLAVAAMAGLHQSTGFGTPPAVAVPAYVGKPFLGGSPSGPRRYITARNGRRLTGNRATRARRLAGFWAMSR